MVPGPQSRGVYSNPIMLVGLCAISVILPKIQEEREDAWVKIKQRVKILRRRKVYLLYRRGKGWPLSSACSRCKVHKIEDMSIFPSVLKTVDGTFLSHKALLRSVFSEKKIACLGPGPEFCGVPYKSESITLFMFIRNDCRELIMCLSLDK